MGRMGAEGFKEMIDQGMTSLDNALIWHLRSNHYPPLPSSMVEPCKTAIELANNDEWDELVQLPEGTTYKGEDCAPVWAIIEAHHLDSFLDNEEE